jgi:DNA-binding XRE family transcriptional regulator
VRGLTQRDLARIVPCRQATISQIESRRHRPSRKSARLLAAALGLDIREIFLPDEIFRPIPQARKKAKAAAEISDDRT